MSIGCLISCSKQSNTTDLGNDTVVTTHISYPEGFNGFDNGDNQSNTTDLGNDTVVTSHISYPEGFNGFDNGDNICFIKYRNKINGYDVKIAVRQFGYVDSSLYGNAEIAFLRNDTRVLYFRNYYFRIDSLDLKKINNYEVVELDYNYPKINKLKPLKFQQFSSLPFFFLDVNFDGEDELVMNYARQGQRYTNAYVAYGLQHYFEYVSYDYLYDSTRGIAPFSDLDDFSEIDYTKKEISTFYYGGYSDSEKRIYKPINGKISLHRIEDYDSLGWLLARRQILRVDTITTYHNGRECLYRK